ncbi:MAG: hypothetical protein COV44_02170 [Deltaproteobacteria bacterium CG11_big_fil_rev_8_21_14_0_20_45_16]|nr:MAG: hypothetical protein COV44_02170 [Deltaproteobacteria bacterium CG11_big_fil_rev_8_21_14_0_20_45_16]
MSLGLLLLLPAFFGIIHMKSWNPRERILLGFLLTSLLSFSLGFLWLHPELRILKVGNWPHFAGIVWILDGLSFLFCSVAILIYLPASIALREQNSSFQFFFHLFFAALLGAFLTADIFNLFVMFEIFLLSSYALFFGIKQLKEASNFIWINVFGSAVYLFAISYIYQNLSTVNMSDIAMRFEQLPMDRQDIIFLTLSFVFLLKAGLFPLFVWMPQSYPALPSSVLAFVGTLGTKLGLYAFIRWTSIVGGEVLARHADLFLSLAVMTIFLGALGAMGKRSLRNSLAYLGISHIGLLLLCASVGTTNALTALLVYFVHDVIVMAGLFFLCDDIESARNNRSIFNRQSLVSYIFLILILASAGIPPLSGFWGKLQILKFSTQLPMIFISVLVSAFLFVYIGLLIWSRYFVNIDDHSSDKAAGAKIGISFPSFYCLALSLAYAFLVSTQPTFFQFIAKELSDQNLYSVRLHEASINSKSTSQPELDND